VYGQDVKGQALDIYNEGYKFVNPVGVPEIDELFKMRKGEITLLTGIGNYGKSQLKKWYQIMRAIKFGEKFATFPPEDYPIHNFYHELTEILLGCDCTPRNPIRPDRGVYSRAYDFISSHFFYIQPTDLSPTPDYMKERFFELIVKEKIDGADIDPFNQMTNDYNKHGGRSDKYLETVLSDFLRFGQMNNIYFWIVAHPVKMQKGNDKNYPCPDVFDIADGAMWNNKMNNILVYHRPFMQTDPTSPLCEFHTKKIKDQKTVGKKGFILFEFHRPSRRYTFSGVDYMDQIIKERNLIF
jgi:twinkle protein